MTYLLAVLAACANATSSVLQRKAGRKVPQGENLSPRLIWSLLHEPVWFGGILAVTIGFLLQAAALGNPAMSSWAALGQRAKFVSGESILILGATGVAGQLSRAGEVRIRDRDERRARREGGERLRAFCSDQTAPDDRRSHSWFPPLPPRRGQG